MKIHYTLPLVLSFGVAACATPPVAEDMATVPVVRYGETTDAKSFVLLYPAGTPLPVIASVTGTLLAKEDQAQMNVTLKRDVYVYDRWASFDGKHWERGDKLVKSSYQIELPGYKEGKQPEPGRMSAQFDLK